MQGCENGQMQNCENIQNTKMLKWWKCKNVKTVKTYNCENSQNAKMGKRSKCKNVKTVKMQNCENGQNTSKVRVSLLNHNNINNNDLDYDFKDLGI